MNITISAKFKLLDEKKEFISLTDIEIELPYSNKEVTTEKIYQALKTSLYSSIPKGYIIEDITEEEYKKIKEDGEE